MPTRNRMIPMKPIIPRTINKPRNNPDERNGELVRVPSDEIVEEIVEKTSNNKATERTIETIGTITLIKLAVNPNFLPDSSDIVTLQMILPAIQG